MARPAHMLVTFSGIQGTQAAPLDIWTFGVRFQSNRWNPDAAAAAAFAGHYATHLAPLFTTRVRLQKVRVAQIGALGHVDRDSSGAYMQGDAIVDTPGSTALSSAAQGLYPPQTSLVISLGSARAGATGKGRFFLPAPADQINATDLRLSSSQVTALGNSVKSFLNAMGSWNPANTTFGSWGGPAVVSSKGYVSQVTNVRVGRSLDTLRSRRSAMVEGYVTVQL